MLHTPREEDSCGESSVQAGAHVQEQRRGDSGAGVCCRAREGGDTGVRAGPWPARTATGEGEGHSMAVA